METVPGQATRAQRGGGGARLTTHPLGLDGVSGDPGALRGWGGGGLEGEAFWVGWGPDEGLWQGGGGGVWSVRRGGVWGVGSVKRGGGEGAG